MFGLYFQYQQKIRNLKPISAWKISKRNVWYDSTIKVSDFKKEHKNTLNLFKEFTENGVE